MCAGGVWGVVMARVNNKLNLVERKTVFYAIILDLPFCRKLWFTDYSCTPLSTLRVGERQQLLNSFIPRISLVQSYPFCVTPKITLLFFLPLPLSLTSTAMDAGLGLMLLLQLVDLPCFNNFLLIVVRRFDT